MYKNRFAKTVAVAFGLIVLFAMPGLARAQSAPPVSAQTPRAASPGAQPNGDPLPPNDFAGLNYTEKQKGEIDKIHQETELHKAVIVKDQALTADQKDAMLLGYTRIEYGRIFNVLSPEQQKQVRQRITARRAADQAAQKKQPPRNQN